MADAFDVRRLTKTEALVEAYEDAIMALMVKGGVEEYQLNTGQGMQRVRRADLGRLQATLDTLLIRRDVYASRVNGSGVVQITSGSAPRC